MSEAFNAVKVTDKVYWVGAIDWELRNFHGYLTSRGTTYNAYLVLTDKITLVDTVKPAFYDEMISRIRSVIDPSAIDYVVSNHAEMDHSGALARLIAEAKPQKVVASPKGVEALSDHFHWNADVNPVKTGESLDLGNASLKFVETRMLHWPDSMFSYLDDGGVLFSNDAFGMHLASAERFADEIEGSVLEYEAAKYYANILMPFSKLVKKLLGQLPELNLDIKMIAPDHGPIWRENFERIIELYSRFADRKISNKAVVVYDTMWRSTAQMAFAIGEGLTTGGAHVSLMPLEGAHRSDVATELLDAAALVVGSPTMNNQLYPTVADVMTYLKGLKPKNLLGASFGSYGWSGEAVKQLDQMLDEMGVIKIQDGLRVQYVPTHEGLAQCRTLGMAIAERITH